MCLIQNKDIKMFSHHEFSNCHTISHESNFSLRRTLFLKSDIIPDLFSKFMPHFIRDSFGKSDGTDSSWLSDQNTIVLIEKKLWYLCGFTTTCLTTYNSDTIFSYCLDDLLFVFMNWECKWALLLLLRDHCLFYWY